MARRVKVTGVKPDDVSLIPGTRMVKGENRLREPFSGLQMLTMARVHVHTYTDTHILAEAYKNDSIQQ